MQFLSSSGASLRCCMLWLKALLVLALQEPRLAWAKLEIFRRLSKLLQNGSLKKTEHLQQVFLTAVLMLLRSLVRLQLHGYLLLTVGSWHLSGPECLVLSG